MTVSRDRFDSFAPAVTDDGIVIVGGREIDSSRLSEICYVNKARVVYVLLENEETGWQSSLAILIATAISSRWEEM